jgi:UDP-N-acetylglucosamine--N-acetylmuramyl-(pentapeptide) pyrophosphoryl-undecaprenol N-acetylglucosamine transferase
LAKILVAAGASGGHVYPALVTATVLRDRGHDVAFAGGDRLEARLVPEAGFPFHALPVRRPPSVRRELATPRGIRAMGALGRSTLLARTLIATLGPDVVLGMGGFAAVPVTLAAAWRHVALVLHEQNARLSLAQRMPLRWADALALTFPLEDDLLQVRTDIVGMPVRASVARLAALDAAERTRLRTDTRMRLGLDPDAATVFVFGGSLGSGPLNEIVPRVALPPGTQVLHLTGAQRQDPVRAAWEARGVRAQVLAYLDTMDDGYLAADVAVSRSGASTVSELALAGLPAILVPLPTLARGDQEANARVLERAGGATVVLESHPEVAAVIGNELSRLFADVAARQAMSAAARSLAKPEAAHALADVVESVVSN